MTIYTPVFAWPKPEGTDLISQGYDAIADLADAVEATVADVDTRLDSLESDTGWVNVTINPGFAASGDPPQVRRIGKIVYMRGGWANTGMVANGNHTVGTIPVGYRPPAGTEITLGVGSSAGAAVGAGFVTGSSVIIRPPATLGAYYRFAGLCWPID